MHYCLALPLDHDLNKPFHICFIKTVFEKIWRTICLSIFMLEIFMLIKTFIVASSSEVTEELTLLYYASTEVLDNLSK